VTARRVGRAAFADEHGVVTDVSEHAGGDGDTARMTSYDR
jgi:hypothetical protein